jgi:RNA recognition motif-containing protein
VLSNGGVVEHVKKTKDFAFVHFMDRAAAETALANSAHLRIEGSPIAVQWSKPVDKHNYNARKQLTRLLTQSGPNV